MTPIGKSVLHIQLELIVFELAKHINQLFKRLHGRDFIKSDINHNATIGKRGEIVDLRT